MILMGFQKRQEQLYFPRVQTQKILVTSMPLKFTLSTAVEKQSSSLPLPCHIVERQATLARVTCSFATNSDPSKKTMRKPTHKRP